MGVKLLRNLVSQKKSYFIKISTNYLFAAHRLARVSNISCLFLRNQLVPLWFKSAASTRALLILNIFSVRLNVCALLECFFS
jgi:hypothetical protein